LTLGRVASALGQEAVKTARQVGYHGDRRRIYLTDEEGERLEIELARLEDFDRGPLT
jgi:hypothetical protein